MLIAFVILIVLTLFFLKSFKKINESFVNVFYIGFYTLQLVVAIILTILYPNYLLYNGVLLSSALPYFALELFVASAGIYLVVSLSHGRNYISYNDKLIVLCGQFNPNTLSIILALLFSFTIISSLYGSYIIAVFALSFSFTPIAVGFVFARLSVFNRIVWYLLLAVNMLFHTLQGSRGTAVFPILFMLFGYLLSLTSNKRLFKKRLIIVLLCSALLLPFLSFVSDFRSAVGRGLDVSQSTFELMIDFARRKGVNLEDKEDAFRSSLGRLLVEPNVVVPYMTPDYISYRGFDYVVDEIKSIFSFAGEKGRSVSRKERADLGYDVGVASRYGFLVNENTSVEWPLIADAFSRFGYLGVFIYSIFFAMLFKYIENRCNSYYKKNPFLSVCVQLFIIYNGALSYMYSYYSFMKLLVFRLPLMILIIMLINKSIMRQRK